jgi:DNA-binding NtrC family response regulator
MLPPLHGREGDVALLSRHFVREFSRKFQKGFSELSPDAVRILETYPWPGNVRELRNMIERVVLLEEGERLEPDHLPPELLGRRVAPGPAAAAAMRDVLSLPTLAQIEMDHINEVLRLTSGNKSRAARILGISRQGLIEKLRRLRIEETSERSVERA